MTDNPQEPIMEPKPDKTKKRILISISAILLICLGGVIIWGVVPFIPAFAPESHGSASQGNWLVVDPNAGEYVAPEQAPGVAVEGFGILSVPANTKELIGVNLYNPKENEGWYYLTYKISLVDKNGNPSETLYESQLVPPGQYLQDIVISRGLAPGEYKAIMHVQPYRIADLSPTYNADLELTIISR